MFAPKNESNNGGMKTDRGTKRKAQDIEGEDEGKVGLEQGNGEGEAEPVNVVGSNGSGNRNPYYDSKIAELKMEEESVRAGTHPDMLEEYRVHARERDRQLQNADHLRELRLREVELLYDYEKKAARDIFNNSKQQIEERMLAEIADTIKRLEDLRDGIIDEADRAMTRKLRSKTKPGNGTAMEKATNGANGRKQQPSKSFTELGIEFSVEDEMIANDLKLIQDHWRKTAEMFHTSQDMKPAEVKVSGDKLFINDLEFSVGEEVLVRTEVTNEDLLGEIVSVSNRRTMIKLLDGQKVRIMTEHLENGRCSISKYNPEE